MTETEQPSDNSGILKASGPSPDRIAESRRNRVQIMADRNLDEYVDRAEIANELAYLRRLFARYNWPLIDVTKRSIEETASAIMALLAERRRQPAD